MVNAPVLGLDNSRQNRERYGRIIADWLAADRAEVPVTRPEDPSLLMQAVHSRVVWE